MTTVGYGTPVVPDNKLARIFVTMQVLTGIALLSVAISEGVQWVQIETSRIQLDRDNSEIAKRGLKLLINQHSNSLEISQKLESVAYKGSFYKKITCRIVKYFEIISSFLSGSELGRNLALCVPLVFLVILLAVVVGPLEGWGVIDSIYFSIVTLTTVGYGEMIPTHPVSVWFNIAFMFLAVFWCPLFYVAAAKFYLKLHNWNCNRIKREVANQMEGIDAQQQKEEKEIQQKKEKYFQQEKNADYSGKSMENSLYDYISTDVLNPNKRRKYKRRASHIARLTRQRSSREVFDKIEKEERMIPIAQERRSRIFVASFDGHSSDASQEAPSIMMRAKIIKRIAIIIKHELAGQTYNLECRQNHLVIEYPSLAHVMGKWMIPRTAREAFQETALNIICHVGINNLSSNNIDNLFDMPFIQVQEMVNPFVAALKNKETMDTWITCTNILAQELEPNENFSMESF